MCAFMWTLATETYPKSTQRVNANRPNKFNKSKANVRHSTICIIYAYLYNKSTMHAAHQ